MQSSPNHAGHGSREGFTIVELLAAITVFNLLIFGLVKLFIGQNSMVESLEGWAEGDPVLYIKQDADPIARALGIPATLVEERPKPLPLKSDPNSTYVVEVLAVQRQGGNDSARAVFLQTKPKEDVGQGKKDEAKGERDEKKGKKDDAKGGKKSKGKKGRSKG